MSDDPETARQIEELALDDRPLLVLDVDDVLLEFIRPFPRFLNERGFHLTIASFRLTGNVAERETGRLAEQAEVWDLLDEFFHNQAAWQEMTEGAAEALAQLGRSAEIVMLTAMPHRHRFTRRTHLDALGLDDRRCFGFAPVRQRDVGEDGAEGRPDDDARRAFDGDAVAAPGTHFPGDTVAHDSGRSDIRQRGERQRGEYRGGADHPYAPPDRR